MIHSRIAKFFMSLFDQRPKLAVRVRLQTDRVTGGPVLLYPEGVVELNPTAHEVLLLCDGVRTVREVVDLLSRRYDASPDDLRADVAACLDQLQAANLVVTESPSTAS